MFQRATKIDRDSQRFHLVIKLSLKPSTLNCELVLRGSGIGVTAHIALFC